MERMLDGHRTVVQLVECVSCQSWGANRTYMTYHVLSQTCLRRKWTNAVPFSLPLASHLVTNLSIVGLSRTRDSNGLNSACGSHGAVAWRRRGVPKSVGAIRTRYKTSETCIGGKASTTVVNMLACSAQENGTWASQSKYLRCYAMLACNERSWNEELVLQTQVLFQNNAQNWAYGLSDRE